MSYNTSSYKGWGDVDSREAQYNYTPDSDTDYYDGLEMRISSRNTTTPSTFGLGTRKPRRSPPRAPFRQPEGPETTTSSSGYGYVHPLTFSSSSSSSSSSSPSERHCCHSTSRHEELLRTPPKPTPRYDEPIEPLNSLSPRPSTQKRNSIGSRPSLKGNTRTSFTANGDRVEEYVGEESLRIGTHWADEDDYVNGGHVEGLGTRGARRNSGYGRGDTW